MDTTTDDIVLQLKPNNTDTTPILGFDLYYKLDSEFETWKNEKLEANDKPFKIEHCKCGSPYLIYAIGFNQ